MFISAESGIFTGKKLQQDREIAKKEQRDLFRPLMEGLRRDDIIRWDIAKDVMNGDIYGCKKGNVLETVQPNGDHDVSMVLSPNKIETRKFVTPKNNLLPIPQSSRDKNPKLSQNPGY